MMMMMNEASRVSCAGRGARPWLHRRGSCSGGGGDGRRGTLSGSFVQENFACPQSSTATIAVKLKSAVKAGDTLVVVAGWNDATSTATATDSLGDTFAAASDVARNPGAPDSQVVLYATNVRAGTDTVTVHLSASAWFPDVRVAEYSGALVVVGSADSASSATTASAGPLTLLAGDLLVGAGTTNGEFVSAGSGFTKRVITSPDSNLLEDRLIASGGSYSATATDDGSAYVWQAVAFRSGGADAGVDSGSDAGTDAPTEAESGSDAGQDAPADVGADVTDAGDAAGEAEASAEAGVDAAFDAGDAGTDAAVEAGPPPNAPVLVQHVSSSTEELSRGISGNGLTFTPPNAVGAGNALVLGVAYTAGSTWAAAPVTDSLGNAWPSGPSALVHDSQGNMDLAVFVLPGAIQGLAAVGREIERRAQWRGRASGHSRSRRRPSWTTAWPALASNAHLPASLEARLVTLREAYAGIADMVADADADASVSPKTT